MHFGSEKLHVPATLFDSLEMGHRFISLCGKRASHSQAKDSVLFRMLSEVLSLELTASEKLHFAEGLVFLLRLSGILYKGMNYTLTTRGCNGLNCRLIAS